MNKFFILFKKRLVGKFFKIRRDWSAPCLEIITHDYYREIMEDSSIVIILVRFSPRGKIYSSKVLLECPVGTSISTSSIGLRTVSSDQKLADFMKICGLNSLIDPEEAKKFTTYEGD